MVNETALRDVLELLTDMQKQNYTLVYSAMNELASLRETVRALDPTFAEVLEERRLHFAQATFEPLRTTLAACDEIIRRLKAGEVC